MKSGKNAFTLIHLIPQSHKPLSKVFPFDADSVLVSLGYKSSLKALRQGKAKLVLIAGNTPPLRKSELECTLGPDYEGRIEADVSRLRYAQQVFCPPFQWQQRTSIFLFGFIFILFGGVT